MPITKELKNVRKFEKAGFTHEQAEILAESIEESHVDSHETLKDFIQRTIKDSENTLRDEIKDMRYDLLLKIFAIVTGTAGILFAMIKSSHDNEVVGAHRNGSKRGLNSLCLTMVLTHWKMN